MSKIWNRFKQGHQVIGGSSIPWVKAPERKIVGGLVENKLQDMEVVAAATPVEFDYKTSSAKLFKCWVVEKAGVADGDNVVVELRATKRSPEIYVGMNIMKMPATLEAKGKGAVVVKVEEDAANNKVKVYVEKDSIDAVAVGGFMAEAESAGASVELYSKPNEISLEDTVGGDMNFVGIASGIKYLYKNNIPAMPEVVEKNIPNIEWAWFNQI